jgi:hypothetical protein
MQGHIWHDGRFEPLGPARHQRIAFGECEPSSLEPSSDVREERFVVLDLGLGIALFEGGAQARNSLLYVALNHRTFDNRHPAAEMIRGWNHGVQGPDGKQLGACRMRGKRIQLPGLKTFRVRHPVSKCAVG